MNDYSKPVSQHLQNCFLYLSITDVDFLKVARLSIPLNYFSSQVTEDLVGLCYSYYDQFKEAPDKHYSDEVTRFLYKVDEERKGHYYNYIKQVCEMDPPDKKYVLSMFSKFIQAREFEGFLIEARSLVERGNIDKAREMGFKALRAGVPTEEDGIDYPTLDEPSYYKKGIREVVSSTGVRIIDNGIRGLRRTQLVCIFAGYKIGKTWACGQIAREAIIQGRKVLEISHEASAEELEMRHDMAFGSLTSEEDPESVTFYEYDEQGNVTGTHEEVRDTVFNLEPVMRARRAVIGLGGRTKLKKYPMGSCTIGELERYLDYLEAHKHYIPDVLINDYVEKMKLPSAIQGRDQINEAYMNLKRIADERNILVVTASQIKTQFLEKSNITEGGAASEDARKLGNIDLGLFFGANRSQRRRGLMQAYVLVNRSGADKFGCIVSRNLKVGQFTLDCWPLRFEGNSEESSND